MKFTTIIWTEIIKTFLEWRYISTYSFIGKRWRYVINLAL
jgi:hypothetical protein